MKVILSDSSKFQKLSIDQNKVLNHIAHMENRIIDVFKKLKKKKIISEKNFMSLLRTVFHLSVVLYQLYINLHIN